MGQGVGGVERDGPLELGAGLFESFLSRLGKTAAAAYVALVRFDLSGLLAHGGGWVRLRGGAVAIGRHGNETVAAAGERLDIARLLRAVAERGPDFANAKVQGVLEIDERAVSPELLLDGFASDQPAGRRGEQR